MSWYSRIAAVFRAGKLNDELDDELAFHIAERVDELIAAGIPVVETWDLTPTPIDMLVGFSHENIGVAVAEYLHGKKRIRIAIITAADERARRRAKGLAAAATRLGIANTLAPAVPMFVAAAPGTLGSGRKGLTDLTEVFAPEPKLGPRREM